MLLAADVVALVGAFVITVALSRSSVELTWLDRGPALVVCAKLTGLYDRDETLRATPCRTRRRGCGNWRRCARWWHVL